MTRKHIITGWTSGKPSELFRWRRQEVLPYQVVLLPNELQEIYIYRGKGRRSDWCAADWPPKRVRITVEEVKKRRKK